MLDSSFVTTLTQFGAAGLMGMLWIFERRHASTRDRQLDEAHRALLGQERQLQALLNVIRDNTRALQALEIGQRRLIGLLQARLRRQQGVSATAAPP
jgi:hypothetical protein